MQRPCETSFSRRSMVQVETCSGTVSKCFSFCTSSAILIWSLAIMNHGRLLVPVSDWLTQRSLTRPSETSFTKWSYAMKLLLLSPLRLLRNVCRSRKRVLLFGKLVSQRKFKKVTRNRPCYTVQRLLKLVSQRRSAHTFQLKVSMCNSGFSLV